MDELTKERADLLSVIYNLAHQIRQTKDPAKIAEHVDQLSKLRSKLIALGTAKKKAADES